ncbi:MAG TPA: twin-arginine translocase TatA/TatE family subunit [Sphingomicrobium sp.]|nr:twin-arginine translocase TatA/TatE family subunit [Sphingomicrobium sp.]
MFGVDSIELIIVAIAALLFIGPKELPGAMRTVGRWIGKMRGMARHFNSGIEAVIREAELEEMDRKWREENERILREHPMLEPTGALNPAAEARAYLERPDEPLLPLEAPAAPDDDPTPPAERPLP